LQICEQSPRRLVLRDAPGRVWAFRIAMAFFILGGMLCLGLVLTIIGTSDRLLREWEFFLGLAVEVRQTGKDGDGDPIHEAFFALAGGGRVTLTHLGPGRERLDLLAAQVRAFLGLAQGPSRL
jgi:hypothetical protein